MEEDPLTSSELDELEFALSGSPPYLLCLKAAARLLIEVKRLRRAIIALKSRRLKMDIETAVKSLLPHSKDPSEAIIINVDVGDVVSAIKFCEHLIQRGLCIHCHREEMAALSDD